MNSDHNLVMMKVMVKLKRVGKATVRRQWNLEKLKFRQKDLEREVDEKVKLWDSDSLSVEEHWSVLKETVIKSAEKEIGYTKKKRAKKPWVTEEMLEKMDKRRKWKSVNTDKGRVEYRRLNNALRRATDSAREKWWIRQCEEIENLDKIGRVDLVYARVRSLQKDRKGERASKEICNKHGVLLSEVDDIKSRWVEYIEELYDKPGKPRVIPIEDRDGILDDDKGPQLLAEEVRSAIQAMKKKKAEGIDGIPAELWKSLGEHGVKKLVQLCRKMYEQGKWPEDFVKSIMIPIPKKENATDCSDYRTISLIPHASKIMLRILTKRIENKASEYISKTQFGFRSGVGTRDAIGMVRMLCQRMMEHEQELFVCFVDFEKAFDRVNWVKLLEVLRSIGVDWRDRRMIGELYMQQETVVRVGGELSDRAVLGRGVRQGCLLSPLLFSIYAEHMMKEALDDSENGVKVGGRLIQDVRFADDQAMIDGKQEGLQRTMTRLEQTAKLYDMKINVKKTKVMRISRHGGGSVTIVIGGQQVEQVKQFQYLGTIISENGYCIAEVKKRIAMAKEAFKKHREILTKSLSINVRKRIVKAMVWPVALYGGECWTLKKDVTDRLKAFEMWVWRRLERVSWTEKCSNDEVLRRVNERRCIVETIVGRKKNWIGHVLRGDSVLRLVMEGRIEGKRPRGRKRKGMLDELMEEHTYSEMKRFAEEREKWRKWVPRTCHMAEHL